ncbi:hypothetical protein DL98DRAFT_538917 [Cadophora sp. DSE1049]|nr:hypothetical protein DL98DRAFT_538917 [Cadophora sp. DSE1049]
MTDPVTNSIDATLGQTFITSQFGALSISVMQRPLTNPTDGQSMNTAQGDTPSPVQGMKRARQLSLEASDSPPIKRLQVQFQQSGAPYESDMDLDVPVSQPRDSGTLGVQGNAQNSPITGISHGLVFESNLPREIRDEIHAHALALRPGICPPALLEVTTRETRAEILAIYRQVNYVVRKTNYDVFRKIPLGILMRVRHLTLVYEGSTPDSTEQFFQSDKTQLINHFTTLDIDVSCLQGITDLYDRCLYNNLGMIVHRLVIASREGVEKITFVFAGPGSYIVRWVTNEMDSYFGFPSKQIHDDVSGRGLHVLVWEASKAYMKLQARIRKGSYSRRTRW